MITPQANTLILNTVIDATIEQINIISLRKADGEFYRKTVTDIVAMSLTKKNFIFYINENEGNGSIVEVGLHGGNGATVELNSGTCYATQPLLIVKDNTQSLNIEWTVEVK